MKIFIAYKFTGQDKTKPKEKLTQISSAIEEGEHQTFIFSRDIQEWD